MYVQRNIEAHRVTIFAVEKQLHTLDCTAAALVTVHSMCMRHISSVACPTPPYFSTLSHNRYDFREKKVTEHKMCILVVSTTFFETFLILRRIQ